MRVVGVDGYRRGWVAVALRDGRFDGVSLHPTLADVRQLEAEAIGVDVPIGLPVAEPRPADIEARRLLRGRAGSVFTTFPRAVLEATTHAEAVTVARGLGWPAPSQQSFSLRRRILEADTHAHEDPRIVEVHPELSFLELAGRPLAFSKHTWSGFWERVELLAGDAIELPRNLGAVPLIDTLDAAAAAWSAARFASGRAISAPAGYAQRIGAIWR